MLTNTDSRLKTGVTLKMILEAGILSAGVELVGPVPEAKGILNGDGSITISLNSKEKVCEYLSGAARYVAKVSLNGWTYWSAKINGELKSMDSFREEFLRMQAEKPKES
jgi:hypothetical protein